MARKKQDGRRMEEERKKAEKSPWCHTHRGLSVFKMLPQNYAFILKPARKIEEKAWRFGKIIVNLQMETKD